MRTLVAILALSTGLLHAQQNSPAQPVPTPVVAPVLLAAASSLPNTPAVPARTPRISTGVVPARLVHTVNIEESKDFGLRPSSMPRTVELRLTVDATGKPGDLHLVRATDPMIAQEVISAVAQFRYQPATVNGVPTPQAVNLEISVESN